MHACSTQRTQALQAFDNIQSLSYPPSAAKPHYVITTSCQRRHVHVIHLSIIGDSYTNCILCHHAGLQHTMSTLLKPSRFGDAGLSEHRDMINCTFSKMWPPLNSLTIPPPPLHSVSGCKGGGDSPTDIITHQVQTLWLQAKSIATHVKSSKILTILQMEAMFLTVI